MMAFWDKWVVPALILVALLLATAAVVDEGYARATFNMTVAIFLFVVTDRRSKGAR